MSELRRLDELKAHAEQVADAGERPERHLDSYAAHLHCVWLTYYHLRAEERAREAA